MWSLQVLNQIHWLSKTRMSQYQTWRGKVLLDLKDHASVSLVTFLREAYHLSTIQQTLRFSSIFTSTIIFMWTTTPPSCQWTTNRIMHHNLSLLITRIRLIHQHQRNLMTKNLDSCVRCSLDFNSIISFNIYLYSCSNRLF